jgi:hypothetical protein
MTEQFAQEVFRTASESIDVLSPPVDGAIARARTMRRRQRRVTTASVVAAVVVIAGVTWATTRPADEKKPQPSPAHVVASDNPAAIAWYAGGKLHLDQVAVELPPLSDLVEVYGGAVYGDREGVVAHVAADGTRTVIGEKVAAAPLVGSEASGWAAWVDPRGEGPTLVVYDVVGGRLLARLDLPSPGAGWQDLDVGSHPVAIDQDHVFYVTQDGDFAWAPLTDDEPVPLDRQGLLDSASATRVYEEGSRIDMVQSFFSVDFVRRGEGATLSAGGNYVLTRAPGDWMPGWPFRPLLYDARSGDRLESGVGPDELVLDASFGEEHDVVYVVGRAADFAGGADLDGADDPLLTLRSCQLGTADCHDVVLLPRVGERPLLSH